MTKIKNLFFLVFTFGVLSLVSAQTKSVKGIVVGSGEVEGIHIINRTSKKYATTDRFGIFRIEVKVKDTVQVLSLRYQFKEIIISPSDINKAQITLNLEERVNELNEVFITDFLGNLEFDIKNNEVERDIDFYDLGIPGYTGPKLTQAEQRLHDADGGNWGSIGLGGSVNFHKLLNKISGRTKKLRQLVALDRKKTLIEKIELELSESFFSTHELDTIYHKDFFYYLTDQPDFLKRCRDKNELEILHYLDQKLKIYKEDISANLKRN